MSAADPVVSVIVPSFRGGERLRRCLDALLAQDVDGPYEVVLVRSGLSSPEPDHGPPLPVDSRLRVFDHQEPVAAAIARNVGVEHACGEALAFTDADAIPDRGWLSELLSCSEGLRWCVAGAIVNGTPTSTAGTAEYLVAFLDLHPARPPRTAWHGATCNLLLPRWMWDVHGPFDEDMGGGEDTVLTARLHEEGRLRFCPMAVVTHLNRTRWAEVVRHQHEYGLFTPLIAARAPYKLRPLVRYRPLAPIAGLARLVSVTARTVRWARLTPTTGLRAAPVVVAAIAGWTLGVVRAPR